MTYKKLAQYLIVTSLKCSISSSAITSIYIKKIEQPKQKSCNTMLFLDAESFTCSETEFMNTLNCYFQSLKDFYCFQFKNFFFAHIFVIFFKVLGFWLYKGDLLPTISPNKCQRVAILKDSVGQVCIMITFSIQLNVSYLKLSKKKQYSHETLCLLTQKCSDFRW